MNQKFLHVMAGEREADLLSDLSKAGFEVRPSGRMSGGLHVRIRSNTPDESTVTEIVRRVAPEAIFGPSGSPTTHLEGYRAGS